MEKPMKIVLGIILVILAFAAVMSLVFILSGNSNEWIRRLFCFGCK